MSKLKKLISTLVILQLAGCACGPKIIIEKPPEIKLPADPENTVFKLNDTSKPNEVIKAWVVTAVACRDWSKTVKKQIALINKIDN